MPNRLAAATSPYLLQHQDNPVDWWEWSDDAFEEARRLDLPILLSVGYAACHWCHVMAHESFEDERVAEFLRGRFVAIKVDREERPDVDAVYMSATQALTGHGGWPMTVFMTPQGQPFYAGTYFPPQPRHGLPSFGQLVASIHRSWTEQRGEVDGAAGRITEALRETRLDLGTPDPLDPAVVRAALDRAVDTLASQYDSTRGGFGAAPKFPPSMLLEGLLRSYARTGDPRALSMVEGTCEAMARGGLFDQLAGGFARYSVDAEWVVPHFEKMLYDNALLLRVYAHWWRATGDPLAERVTRMTATFLLERLRTPEGAFASALDADSEGEEGKAYVWTPDQLNDVLGEADSAWAARLLEVTPHGTFEHGASVAQLLDDPDDAERWQSVRLRLLAVRDERVQPGRDDKVVTAWNGLAVAALAEAGALLEEPSWVEAAVTAADHVLTAHVDAAGALLRVSRDGRAGTHLGVLEDHGDLAEGLLALHQVTGERRWLDAAGSVLDQALDRFRDSAGGFYDTADDAEPLVVRPQDPTDNATPSGWTATTQALLTYAALTGSDRHRTAAEESLGLLVRLVGSHPRFAGWALAAAEAWLDGPREVAVVGDQADPAATLLRRTALLSTAPGSVLAAGPAGSEHPLLAGRPLVAGAPAAYVCRHFTCDAPVTDPAALAVALGARTP
ncbi:thioredoxin domain-containing protein [Longivirga aurantiaca]|uniref:Thioredoxin domain-containing protein n=1 Tax=Longivirga aurantiaca TaxID=1837743 RepID=A0ABW1T0L1_9ACTN